jgi:hypothetical protein
VSLTTARRGAQVKRMLIRVNTGACGISEDILVTRRSVAASGTFSENGSLGSQTVGRQETARLDVEVHGRLRGGRVSGTIRVAGPVTDSTGAQVSSCDSGTVRWSARRGSDFGGGTSQEAPLTFRLARDRRHVSRFAIDWRVRCGGVEQTGLRLPIPSLPVSRTGRFEKRVFTAIPIRLANGAVAQGQYVMRGRVRGERASGTYRVYGSLIAPDGTKLACDTRTLRWTAGRG